MENVIGIKQKQGRNPWQQIKSHNLQLNQRKLLSASLFTQQYQRISINPNNYQSILSSYAPNFFFSKDSIKNGKQELLKKFNIVQFEMPDTKPHQGKIILSQKQLIIELDTNNIHGHEFFKINLEKLNKIKFLFHKEINRQIIRLNEAKEFYISTIIDNIQLKNLNYGLFWSILSLKLTQMDKQYSGIMFFQKKYPLQQIIDHSLVYGYVYKKSKYFGKWCKRFSVINQNGFFSYQDEQSANYTFCIKAQDIKQIWTRFEFYDDYLIIKILSNHLKTQIGIPVINFLEAKNNWLYQFIKMMQNNFENHT